MFSTCNIRLDDLNILLFMCISIIVHRKGRHSFDICKRSGKKNAKEEEKRIRKLQKDLSGEAQSKGFVQKNQL